MVSALGSKNQQTPRQFETQNYNKITMRLFLLCLYVTTAIALPTVLITTPKPWCVTVDGAQDEALQVEYEAPGELMTFENRLRLYLSFYVIQRIRLTK